MQDFADRDVRCEKDKMKTSVPNISISKAWKQAEARELMTCQLEHPQAPKLSRICVASFTLGQVPSGTITFRKAWKPSSEPRPHKYSHKPQGFQRQGSKYSVTCQSYFICVLTSYVAMLIDIIELPQSRRDKHVFFLCHDAFMAEWYLEHGTDHSDVLLCS